MEHFEKIYEAFAVTLSPHAKYMEPFDPLMGHWGISIPQLEGSSPYIHDNYSPMCMYACVFICSSVYVIVLNDESL